MTKLEEYVNNLPNRNCKGVPYKRIKGTNIFNEDLSKKLYIPLRSIIGSVRYARNYTEVHKDLARFIKNMVQLPYQTPKSKVWLDAFKGEGAYYTLKNLVMFHDCKIYGVHVAYSDTMAVTYLHDKLNEYHGEGWRMFALLKKVIKDNGFDFNARMYQIYNK